MLTEMVEYCCKMEEQMKGPQVELSDAEIANLSDAEFKTLVIRVLTEMVEYGCKIEKKGINKHSIRRE